MTSRQIWKSLLAIAALLAAIAVPPAFSQGAVQKPEVTVYASPT
ncbi:MAG: hypothetical protein ACK4N4_08115 [Burkholderiales bacterium]